MDAEFDRGVESVLGGDTCRPRGWHASGRLELALNQERDNDTEQRRTFDKGSENQRRRLNATRRFWLTRHAFNGLTTNTTDAEPGTNSGEPSAESGADECEALIVASCFGRGLQEWENRHEHLQVNQCANCAAPR